MGLHQLDRVGETMTDSIPMNDAETAPNSMQLRKRDTRPLQSPGDVLTFWFDDVATNPAKLKERNKFWWNGGDDVDRLIASRCLELLARLASGEAEEWSSRGPAERLAAIVALDQFTRNIFRNQSYAFENDELALQICKEGIASGADKVLSPVKRWFFYLPLEHSENLADQDQCVLLFSDLLSETDDIYHDTIENALDFAKSHREVIYQFGRFPHRNKALNRRSTPAELKYLAQPGAGF